VPVDLRKRYEDNVYVDTAMMTATIPGRPASEVFEAALRAYAEKGYPEEYRLHHQGGAIGYMGRDYKVTAQTREINRETKPLPGIHRLRELKAKIRCLPQRMVQLSSPNPRFFQYSLLKEMAMYSKGRTSWNYKKEVSTCEEKKGTVRRGASP